MLKILAPIDGSNHTSRVIDYLIQTARDAKAMQVQLINVREPVNVPEISRFWSPEQIADFQQKEGRALLQHAAERLTAAGIPNTTQVLVGDIAQTIVTHAQAENCDLIAMGSHGLSAIANLLMGSVATKVVHLAQVPVTLVK